MNEAEQTETVEKEVMVRQATPKDLNAMGILWLDMVREKLPGCMPNPYWWIGTAELAMRSGNYVAAIAELGDDAIGFMDFFIFPEPSDGKIHMVGQHAYVEPSYRGTMVAAMLYKECVTEGKKAGAEVRELMCGVDDVGTWMKKGYEVARVMMRKKMTRDVTTTVEEGPPDV